MPMPHSIVVLKIHAQSYGLIFPAVDRIIRLIEYFALPNAPQNVIGVIHFQGAVLPVISMRRRFGLPEREPMPSDHLVLAHTARRRLALLVDEVCGFERVSTEDWVTMDSIGTQLSDMGISGVAKRPDGLIMIHNLDRCLALDEQMTLDVALSASSSATAAAKLSAAHEPR
ncbi:MAG: chemotaxis protein CheW [Candidatus Methylacidiphilales bacterium]|nr:chemotaxis protein CheW [Candidatus Methylacidiphilales bacterium]